MSRGSAGRLALLALLWGSSFLWIKLALRGFDPVQVVLIRLGLGAAVLIPMAVTGGRRFPTGATMWIRLTVAALFANALPYLLFGIGEQTTGSDVAGMLNATTPLWTVLVGLASGADRALGPRRGAGIALGLAGTVLIFEPWSSGAGDIASWGGLAFLAAAISYGLSYVYIGKYLTGRGIPPMVLAAAQLTVATGWLLLAVPVGGRSAVHWRPDAIVAVLILGVLGTGVAYVLNYRLIEDEGATTASIVTYLLPVIATALGAVVLNEPVTVPMILGMLLILTGVALTRRRPSPPGPVPAGEPLGAGLSHGPDGGTGGAAGEPGGPTTAKS
jgi:drug/metabolite transporter (DMT)-like permease